MNRPSLSDGSYWDDFILRATKVLMLAMKRLHSNTNLAVGEVPINREFFRYIKRANLELKNEGTTINPSFDSPQGPDADSDEVQQYESARPDFKWSFADHQADEEKNFDVECKRLGKRERQWVLNENYIKNGVARFIHIEHSYGHRSDYGVMVGYVQNMEPDDILNDVNATAVSQSVPELVLAPEGWKTDISELKNFVERSFEYSPYSLQHYWIDLRGSCQAPPAPEPKQKTKRTRKITSDN